MIRLPRIIWSGLVPACWSPSGYFVRALIVVLSLSWVAAGALDPAASSSGARSLQGLILVDPLWSPGAYSLDPGPPEPTNP